MSAPINVTADGQRPPRRSNRKGQASKNHGASQASASPIPMSNATISTPAIYDGSSEPTPPPNSHRKPKRHNNQQGHQNQQAINGSNRVPNQSRNHSQPYVNAPQPPNATPVKAAAYAGPTFHASPAASSLPMPKMFSKSLPESQANIPPSPVAEFSDFARESSEEPPATFTPEPKGREPSPLDFLFNAARQARGGTPNHERTPSFRSAHLSPSEENSDPIRGSETPTSRAATLFPLELDNNNASPGTIGPAFATPFKDRMSAYRSREPSIQSNEGSLDEAERAAKTDALKRFLGQQASPKSPHMSPYSIDQSRPSPQRHHSGPNTPTQYAPVPNWQQRPPSNSPSAGNDFPFRDIITSRPPTKLRNQVSPPYAEPPRNTSTGYEAPSPSRTPRAMDAKRLEDDLRRVLKLDLSS